MSEVTDEQFAEKVAKKEYTADEKIAISAKLCRPWEKQLNMLAQAYLKEYPTETTHKDVMRAVTVQVPLTAFMAMLTAVSTVVTIAPKEVVDAVHISAEA